MKGSCLVKLPIVALTLTMFWCGGNRAYAQVAQGASATLTGRITDSTGAVIPGASLSLASAGGALPETSVSNEVGYYTFSGLRPGAYKLTVSKAGFGDVVIPEITLEVQRTASVDVTLLPGTVTQQITVSAGIVALQTQTSDLSGIVSNTVEQQLPLSTRDPTTLVDLVPGVTADMRGTGGSTAVYADSGGLSFQGRLDFKLNGGTNEQAIAMVDGVDITIDAGGFNSVPSMPTPDATQEFSVMTSNYSAQFGRGTGILNVVTKSGTNNLHGTVYEFLQNNVLNANDLFSNAAGVALPHSERNQWGFAVGGPVWLPHVYDGRNKAFWFMDLERLDQVRFEPLTLSVPSAAERQGDFSNFYTTAGELIPIYNPFNTITAADGSIQRVPFPNNQVPINNTFATNILKYWPLPNTSGVRAPNGGFTGVSDEILGGGAPLNMDRMDIKADYAVSDANRVMWRYSRSLYHVLPVNLFTDPVAISNYTTRNDNQNGYNMVMSDTWTVSPTLVVTNSVNWSRLVDAITPSPKFDVTQLGGPFADGTIESFVKAHNGGSNFPEICITGVTACTGMSYGNTFVELASNYGYALGVVKTHGKHTLSLGFQANLLQYVTQITSEGWGGQFSFSGAFTQGPNPLNPAANTGSGIADLEQGIIGGGEIESGYSTLTASKYLAWYLQDDIKVTPKLTLNLGLRYDFTTPETERHNQAYYFTPSLPNPIGNFGGPNTSGGTVNQWLANYGAGPVMGTEQFVNSPGSSGRGVVPYDYADPSPRAGFAYSPRKSLVIRGGLAKLYTLAPQTANVFPAGIGPFTAATTVTPTVDGIHPAVTLDNPYPNGFNVPTRDSLGQLSQVGIAGLLMNGDAHHTPFDYQWNLGVQTQVPGNATLSIAYAGTVSHFLQCPYFSCGNQVPYNLVQKYGAKLDQSVPNPYYGIITNPSALLSSPTLQLGQLFEQWGAFPGTTVFLPSINGTGVNQDVFQSEFNALEVQYTKHLSHGLSLQVAYTWSKLLTNADAAVGSFLGPVQGYQNVTNFAGEWSPSAESVPQRLVIGHVYDLPVGKGEQFGSSWSAAVDKVLGHWQFSGITTLEQGYPIGVTEGGHTTGAFGGGDRPNQIGNPCLSGQSRSQLIMNGGLNPAAFAVAAPYSFGNAPRTQCLSNGEINMDWSLIKFIPIRERYKIEFRSEFFNAFNRTQLAPPDTAFNTSGFGLITAQGNTPRVIQFGLKLSW